MVFLPLMVFLTALASSCAHQPWDIDTHIKNLERPERDEYQQPETVVEALNLTAGKLWRISERGRGISHAVWSKRWGRPVR